MSNNIDPQYNQLVQDILDNGVKKQTRNGEVLSVFGRQIRHKMSDGFPLLTTKKMHWKSIVTELLWFLRGDTNIKFLVDNENTIWVGDAYKKYETAVYNNGATYINDVKDYDEIILEDGTDWIIVTPHTKEEFINKIKTDDEFAKKWGELGPIYGKQWRNWKGFTHGWHDVAKVIDGLAPHEPYLKGIDQIANLIHELKTNPDSRRLMVNAWNVGELDEMVLPPCHYGFQVYTREMDINERIKVFYYTHPNKTLEDFAPPKGMMEVQSVTHQVKTRLNNANIPTRAISLMWNQRSVDVGLGLPFNIASYGLLLEILAKEVNMVPDELIGNLGDTHIYTNHIDGLKEQLTREPFELPTITLPSALQHNSGNWGKLIFDDFYLNDYKSHPSIKLPLSN